MEKCSTSLTIRGMQIKTIVRFYLTPGRMAVIKKTRNQQFPLCCSGLMMGLSLRRCWFNPQYGNFHMPQATGAAEKEKKKIDFDRIRTQWL